VEVINFDGDVRVQLRLDVELHDAELHLPLLRSEEEDPIEPVPLLQTDDFSIEGSTLLESIRQDVGLYPLDRHLGSLLSAVPPGKDRARPLTHEFLPAKGLRPSVQRADPVPRLEIRGTRAQ